MIAELHPDLFGGLTRIISPRRKRLDRYAAAPGTGPEGERCRSCRHHVVWWYSRRYHKCEYTATHSAATDIRVRTPACHYWQPA